MREDNHRPRTDLALARNLEDVSVVNADILEDQDDDPCAIHDDVERIEKAIGVEPCVAFAWIEVGLD